MTNEFGQPMILIVDDEPAIAELVKYSLRADGWHSCSASNVADAWELIQRQTPKLVVLDWMLRGQSGLHLLSRIRCDRDLCALPVIMLTAKASVSDKLAGLDSGADDYMTKPFSPRELRARTRALLRRKSRDFQPGPIRVANIALDPINYTVRVDEKRIAIGQSEYRLLKFLLSNPGQVFSRHQLLDKVWDLKGAAEERTVDVHVLRLRKVLREARCLIKTVRGAGYMLSGA
ncbi:MAG: response regulator [Telluria sp.]